MNRRAIFSALLLLLVVSTTGCPRKTRKPLVPAVPTTGNAEARSRFQRAHAQFERDGTLGTAEFQAIANEFPDDPIAPYALLYAGISAVRGGELDKGIASLDTLDRDQRVDPGIRARARLFLGVAWNYSGEHTKALTYLTGAKAAVENDEERGEWLAALAESMSRGSSPLGALVHYDGWYKVAHESERVYIIARMRALVDAADAAGARRAYGALAGHGSPAAAILGARVVADYVAAGDTGRAERVSKDTAKARKNLGMAGGGTRSSGGKVGRLGAILPLSGSRGRLGDLAARGLAMASGVFGASAGDPYSLSIRDSGSKRVGAVSGLGELASEGVIAVVGPIDGKSVEASAAESARLGVAQISLDPRSEKQRALSSAYVFHIVHSAEDRARALARFAYRNGIRDFAIFGPDNGYGHAVGGAFRAQVDKLGGTIVVEHHYAANETSFGKAVAKIRKPWQAIFVPDRAARLALVAPALAAANLSSRPIGSKAKRGRTILLLSTAEAVTATYLRSAGRYSRGAVFAPGFYPDRFDPRIADFVDRYEEAFARLPTSWDAYAYDAAQMIRSVVTGGATTRKRVAAGLMREKLTGLTGTVSFGADRRRGDDGLLYVVDRRSGDYVIRSMRD